MHDLNRVIIDAHIPTVPRCGFSPTRQALLSPRLRSTVRCSASRMKGELHPTNKVRGADCILAPG